MRTLLLSLLLSSSTLAAEPTLRSLSVRGLQIGAATTLTVEGDDLTTSPKLLLPFPAEIELKADPKPTEKTATFVVKLGDKVSPGYYQVRVQTLGGVSPPMLIAVDRLAQVPFAKFVEKLPTALHGALTGSTVLETTFTGKAKQMVKVEVEAGRFGSKLRPVIHVYNARRRQLSWAWPTPTFAGDTQLSVTLPEDDTYIVTLHDAEYAGPTPGHFRLKIGEFASAAQVFPPLIDADTKDVELSNGTDHFKLNLPTPREQFAKLNWPKEQTWTGPQPFVSVSKRKELVAELGPEPQPIPTGFVGVSGKFTRPNMEARFKLPVKTGEKLRFEVFADRIGSTMDCVFLLRNEAGTELVRAEDSPGSLDPIQEYTVPEKLPFVIACVQNPLGKGIFRLAVNPVSVDQSLQDVQLRTPVGRINIPQGGRALVPVFAERTNFDGPLTLQAVNLPAGVTLQNNMIPAGATGTLVEVFHQGVAGEAKISEWKLAGEFNTSVRQLGHPVEKLQPWLASEIAVAVVPKAPDGFAVTWKNTPKDLALVPTQKLSLPLAVTRPDPATTVRITLISSQGPTLVNNQPDPNRQIRLEKPIELGAKISDTEVSLVVPADLPSKSYDIAVQAEILSLDKKTVSATVFSPLLRLPVKEPLVVALTGTPKVEAKYDAKVGFTAEFPISIERRPHVAGDITLSATGLPAGARLEAQTVKVDAKTFVIKLIFPANQPTGEIRGVKVGGSYAPDAKAPNVRVKTRDLELSVYVPPLPKK